MFLLILFYFFLSSFLNILYLEEKIFFVSFNGCDDVKGYIYWKFCIKILIESYIVFFICESLILLYLEMDLKIKCFISFFLGECYGINW